MPDASQPESGSLVRSPERVAAVDVGAVSEVGAVPETDACGTGVDRVHTAPEPAVIRGEEPSLQRACDGPCCGACAHAARGARASGVLERRYQKSVSRFKRTMLRGIRANLGDLGLI